MYPYGIVTFLASMGLAGFATKTAASFWETNQTNNPRKYYFLHATETSLHSHAPKPSA